MLSDIIRNAIGNNSLNMQHNGIMIDVRHNNQQPGVNNQNQNDMTGNNVNNTSSETLPNLTSPIEYKPGDSLLLNGDSSFSGNGNYLKKFRFNLRRIISSCYNRDYLNIYLNKIKTEYIFRIVDPFYLLSI